MNSNSAPESNLRRLSDYRSPEPSDRHAIDDILGVEIAPVQSVNLERCLRGDGHTTQKPGGEAVTATVIPLFPDGPDEVEGDELGEMMYTSPFPPYGNAQPYKYPEGDGYDDEPNEPELPTNS